MEVEKNLKVFVYGTLKIGGRFAQYFNPYRVSVKKGQIKGTMFNLGSFPGVVLNGDTIIEGEIHEYNQADSTEANLDSLEGFRGNNNSTNLYNKDIVEVTTDTGTELCKVYTFARSIEGFKKIKEGIWEI